MRLDRLAELLHGLLVPPRRAPDFIIGGAQRPYLNRWFLIPRNGVFNIYLHQFLRSDDDRALHDHPWWSLSIVLKGWMLEHDLDARSAPHVRYLEAGHIRLRGAAYAHRLSLPEGRTCWTLFITGPRIREWGFHCPQGWKHWRDFTAPSDSGQIGRGCD